MNRSINLDLSVACLAISMSLAAGCGNFSEDEFGANPSIEQETQTQLRIHVPTHSQIEEVDFSEVIFKGVVNDTDVDPLPEGLGEVDVVEIAFDEPLEDGFADGITDGGERAEEVHEDDRLENGFEDGVATEREWKRLANATCAQDGVWVSAITVANQVENALYRAAHFTCADLAEDSDDVEESKMIAVVLGDDTACRTYDDLREDLARICGEDAEIVAKQAYGRCSGHAEHGLVQRVLFVCQVD